MGTMSILNFNGEAKRRKCSLGRSMDRERLPMWKTDCHDSWLEDWFDLEMGEGEELLGGKVIDPHFKD